MHMVPVGASGTPSNWATWWVLDGGDDAQSLLAADLRGALNQAVQIKLFLAPPPWTPPLLDPSQCLSMLLDLSTMTSTKKLGVDAC